MWMESPTVFTLGCLMRNFFNLFFLLYHSFKAREVRDITTSVDIYPYKILNIEKDKPYN